MSSNVTIHNYRQPSTEFLHPIPQFFNQIQRPYNQRMRKNSFNFSSVCPMGEFFSEAKQIYIP